MPTREQIIGMGVERLSLPKKFAGPGAKLHFPPDFEIEPMHLELAVALDIPGQSLTGQAKYRIEARASEARCITLNAIDFEGLKVSGWDGSGKKPSGLSWTYDGELIEITWDSPMALGEKRYLQVSYKVVEPAAGLYFMSPTELEPDLSTYAATDHETEKARHWLPCIDLPHVRTTLDIRITANAQYTILANGTLKEEEMVDKQRKCAHWVLDQRCPSYLICFAVGEFTRYDDDNFENIPLAYFSGKDFTPEDLKRTFGRTKPMLEWITKKLDMAFPYPKYFQFALPCFGGAMENISLVSWSDGFLLNEKAAPELQWLTDQVNVHEMAHSYFGDLVVCRDYANAWLKESWATYIETCYLEDHKGNDEKLYDLYRNRKAYLKESDDSYKRPIYNRYFRSSWQMYDRHLYPGGACRLHTLRQKVGEQSFWNGTQQYLKRFAEKTVEMDDFRKVMEESSGQSLVRFFDQWFANPDYPELGVEFEYSEEDHRGVFHLVQKQFDPKKEEPETGSLFDLDVTLEWRVEGHVRRETVSFCRQKQSFSFAMEKDPDYVMVDPECTLVHKLEFEPGREKLLCLLENGNLIGRIIAAYQLAKSGKRNHLDRIYQQYQKETFWGARCQMAAAIGNANTAHGVRLLSKLIAEENDPMVQESVFASASAYRDKGILNATLARLKQGGLGYYAESAAYSVLGRQRDDAPLDLIQNAAKTPDNQRGSVQSFALRALALSRKEEAVDFLLGCCPQGKQPFRSRAWAFHAAGIIARFVDKGKRAKIIDVLKEGLRDSQYWVRQGAAHGISAALATELAGALESYGQTLPLQEQVAVSNMVRGLSEGESSQVKALEKKFDELQEKFHGLTDTLEKLAAKVSGENNKGSTLPS